MFFAVLEQIYGSEKIVFHHLPAGNLSIQSSKYGWIGRTIDHPIDFRQVVEIGDNSDITPEQCDAKIPEKSHCDF